MKHAEIIAKVRSILNEHGSDDVLSIADDRVLLDDYINEAIPDAVVMLATKGYRVNVKVFTTIDSDGAITLPDDFVSLVSLKLSTWNRAVKSVGEMDSPEYIMAMNEYTQPGPNTPYCYRDGSALRCMPKGELNAQASEYNAKYVNMINADSKEAAAVCYMAAALVLGVFGDDAGKQRLSDISMNMLQ